MSRPWYVTVLTDDVPLACQGVPRRPRLAHGVCCAAQPGVDGGVGAELRGAFDVRRMSSLP